MKPLALYLLLAATFLVSSYAKAENRDYLSLLRPVSVNGHQLKAGEYDVTWSGSEANIELEFRFHGKVVATAAAQILRTAHPFAQGSVVLNRNADGSMSIAEIRFRGRKFVLVIVAAK